MLASMRALIGREAALSVRVGGASLPDSGSEPPNSGARRPGRSCFFSQFRLGTYDRRRETPGYVVLLLPVPARNYDPRRETPGLVVLLVPAPPRHLRMAARDGRAC